MKTTRSVVFVKQAALLLLLLTVGPQLSTAFAQGMIFTYQGRLDDGGSPANGVYSMEFYLYDVETNGSPMDNVGVASISVTNGLFTTPLAFSPGSFNGDDRWLEISVEKSGDGSFTTLAPRQKFTATPYAIMAGSASNLLGVVQNSSLPTNPNFSGTVTGDSFSGDGGGLTNLSAAGLPGNVALLNSNQTFTGQNSFSGNVGIGVTNPNAPLQVFGGNTFPQLAVSVPTNSPYGAFLSLDASATTNGKDYFIFSSGNGAGEGQGKLIFLNHSDGVYPLVLASNGNVGIDAVNPVSQLTLGTYLGGTVGSLVSNDTKQLVLGGDYNGGYNFSNSVKLLISDYDNDGSDIYPIYVEDENNLVDFYIHNRSLAEPLRSASAYFGGVVGIGTTTPQSSLQVSGGILARGGPPGPGGVFNNGYAFLGSGGDDDSGMFSSADGQIEFYNNAIEAMRIVNGNVGIGITGPTSPLQVNGDVRLGTGGTNYATSGTENLRIVRGSINADGSIARGSGFIASHNGSVGTGSYTIVFSPAFSGVPSVTVTAVNVAARAGGAITATAVTVSTINFSTSSPVDDSFSFIAVGPP